jgi:hypothetical protein
MARDLNEPLPGGGVPPPATLKRGSQGEAVRDWQRIIGLVADGIFGEDTERATKVWQHERGIVSDGVVGPKTWAEAERFVEEVTSDIPYVTGLSDETRAAIAEDKRRQILAKDLPDE